MLKTPPSRWFLHWEGLRQDAAPALARITLSKVQYNITWQTVPEEVLLRVNTQAQVC
jgi:hypothetical protein